MIAGVVSIDQLQDLDGWQSDFNNKLIINFGRSSGNTTFAISFSNARWCMTTTMVVDATGQTYTYPDKIRSKTKTGFVLYTNCSNSNFIAIGT